MAIKSTQRCQDVPRDRRHIKQTEKHTKAEEKCFFFCMFVINHTLHGITATVKIAFERREENERKRHDLLIRYMRNIQFKKTNKQQKHKNCIFSVFNKALFRRFANGGRLGMLVGFLSFHCFPAGTASHRR